MSLGPPQDPLTALRDYLPGPLESYYIGVVIGAVILPIIVGMFYVTKEVRDLIKDKPYYGAVRTHVNSTYNLLLFVLVCSLVVMLYITRKGVDVADPKNIGFWYTLIFLPMIALLGARLSTSISFLVLSRSNDLMFLEPSEVVYVKQKLSYLTSGILITFIMSTAAWVLINANDIIDLSQEIVSMNKVVRDSMSGSG